MTSRPIALAAATALCLYLHGCTSPEEEDQIARHTLDVSGYSAIEITRAANRFRCGHDAAHVRAFTALGPTGKPASGVVCWGVASDPVIRIQ